MFHHSQFLSLRTSKCELKVSPPNPHSRSSAFLPARPTRPAHTPPPREQKRKKRKVEEGQGQTDIICPKTGPLTPPHQFVSIFFVEGNEMGVCCGNCAKRVGLRGHVRFIASLGFLLVLRPTPGSPAPLREAGGAPHRWQPRAHFFLFLVFFLPSSSILGKEAMRLRARTPLQTLRVLSSIDRESRVCVADVNSSLHSRARVKRGHRA